VAHTGAEHARVRVDVDLHRGVAVCLGVKAPTVFAGCKLLAAGCLHALVDLRAIVANDPSDQDMGARQRWHILAQSMRVCALMWTCTGALRCVWE